MESLHLFAGDQVATGPMQWRQTGQEVCLPLGSIPATIFRTGTEMVIRGCAAGVSMNPLQQATTSFGGSRPRTFTDRPSSAPCDEFAWTALISEQANSGQAQQALKLYQEMIDRGVKPSSYTFVAALKACSRLRDLETAKQIHSNVVINGFQSVLHVGNMLVHVYAKCASLEDARHAFESLSHRTVVSWTAMILGYARMGEGQLALQLYTRMQEEGLVPNDRTYVGALKACSSLAESEKKDKRDGRLVKANRCLEYVRAVHLDIVKSGSESGVHVGTMLVDAYAKAESLVDSRSVFEKMPYRNVVSWNAMILGYVQMEECEEAMHLYARMKQEGIQPNELTYGGVLRACSSRLNALEGGAEENRQLAARKWCLEHIQTVHTDIVKSGCDPAVYVWNMLMDLYVGCGSLKSAEQVFEEMPQRSVVSWNTMLWGYVQMDDGINALNLYSRMLKAGVTLDDRTFVGALKACSSLAAVEDWANMEDGTCLKKMCLELVRAIHSETVRRGCAEAVFVGTMLVDAYAKCGSLVAARCVFDQIPHHDVVSWTAMISGYAMLDKGDEALQLYRRMQMEGVSPNEWTLIGALRACGVVAGLERGKEIHARISTTGLEAFGSLLPTSLIDMYCKCGSMDCAQDVFNALLSRPVATWNALMSGYAHYGDSRLVFDLFQRMKQEGTQPDSVTFLNILTVCSHVGLVDKGQEYLSAMSSEYGFPPTRDHYTCVVDLLGRAGQVDKALAMVENLPVRADSVVWLCVLSACQKWKNVELGSIAFEAAVRLDETDPAAYVLMSNVYASAHMLEDANSIQARRVESGAWKQPGRSSWTDSTGIVHPFLAGNRTHSEYSRICNKLDDLFVKMRE